MGIILFTTIKDSKCKLRPFEHTQSMSKWPTEFVYMGNIINYFIYPPDPFPRGLELDLERSSTFPILILLINIDRLDLFSYLYRYLFNCITMCQGSWAGATAFYIESGWFYTIAVLAWCSTHQLPGCECTVNVSCTPLRHLNAAYIGIYSYMHPYIHAFKCI